MAAEIEIATFHRSEKEVLKIFWCFIFLFSMGCCKKEFRHETFFWNLVLNRYVSNSIIFNLAFLCDLFFNNGNMQLWVYNCGLTMINNQGLQIITNYNQELRDAREGVWEVDYHSFLINNFKGKVWKGSQANKTGYWECYFSELTDFKRFLFSFYKNFLKAYKLVFRLQIWGIVLIYKKTFTFNYCKHTVYHVLF